MQIEYILQAHGLVGRGGGGGQSAPLPTIENLSGQSNALGTQIVLTWDNPAIAEFQKVQIFMGTTDISNSTYEHLSANGTKIVDSNIETYAVSGLVHNDIRYFKAFGIFSVFGEQKVSSGVSIQAQVKDITPPNPITNFTATGGDTKVLLKWTNPNDSDFSKVRIMYKANSYPTSISDGTLAYEGVEASKTITGLTNDDIEYFFRAFTYDTTGNINSSASQQAKATPSEPKIYGFTINEAESNPLASVTYTDKATAFSKGSVDWDTSPLFAHIKPCLFKDGEVVGYLQRNDYTKFENGTAADITSGNAGDVMVEIPKMAYYMEKSGNIITAKVLIGGVDAKTVDARYSYLPFSRDAEGDRDKIYIGAYLGNTLSDKLRSLSGKAPSATQTIGTFRTQAQTNGTGYQQLPFYQLTLLQILYIMKYGSLNSQTALGRGYVDGNSAAATTGGTNTKGFCYGETTGKQQMKIFGIEDFWGNLCQWVDGLFCNASRAILTTYKAFNDTGSDYLFNNSSGNSTNTGGYMNVSQGGTQTGFNIKTAAGSNSTYYSDDARLYAGCLPYFGGSWTNASGAGAFRLSVDGSAFSGYSNIGARLCYI